MLTTPPQNNISVAFVFREESPPLSIGAAFTLDDFDTPLPANVSLLTLTLSNRVDGVDEGLTLNTSGTGVTVAMEMTSVDFTSVYVLSGAENYSEYQQVSDNVAEFLDGDFCENLFCLSLCLLFLFSTGFADSAIFQRTARAEWPGGASGYHSARRDDGARL